MTFAKSERADLTDLLDRLGPDAPTLCVPWTAHDLAAHLWIRENDPLAASGLVAKPLAGLTERRMADVKQRWPFSELVERIRSGPAKFSVFAFPGVDEPANTTEFFIHHEDLRRAGDHPLEPRNLPAEEEDWLWRRLKLLGRAFFRRAQVGVVLERLGTDVQPVERNEGDLLRVVSGSTIVTIVGRPSELMLFGNGRAQVADVTLVGEPEAIDILHSTDFRR
jgi:uncharacterized protein (TIGR03085 family)